MPEPNNLEEYQQRFASNQGAEGWGVDVKAVFPCPFCAAPRWAVVAILQMESVLTKPHHCGECGRSAKAIFNRTAAGVSFEIVQTGGDDQPDWLTPKMRRVQ